MDNPFQLQNKNILVTGASSGIGEICAMKLSEVGARVILIARDPQRLKETLSKMNGKNHVSFSQDITDSEKLDAVIVQAVEKLGTIHGFINAAGVERSIPLRNMTADEYRSIYEINCIAAFELARIVSKKKFMDPAGGSFVFISSVMGMLGQAGKTAYCSSKGALIAGTRAIALELASKNIRVNCVSPALVETKMTTELLSRLNEEQIAQVKSQHPLGLGKPEDIANTCLFLLSPLSRWITGSNLVADGGYSIV